MTQTARFYIDVPIDNLEQAEQALQDMGINLTTTDHMLHLPDENILYHIFTGEDAQYALGRVKKHMLDHGYAERITQKFHRMTVETRRDFLELATVSITWNTDFPPDIESVESNAIETFLDAHSDIWET